MIDLCETDSIKKAIIELKATKREWERKANLCAEMIAALLADTIKANIDAIPYSDDVINVKTHQYERKSPDIYVMSQGNGVFVLGEEVVFIEFGAGYTHNSNGSENPLSKEFAEVTKLNTDIGSYGKGQGLQPYWFFAHNLISKGTPMYMPIYRAIIAIKPEVPTLVRQVFV